MKVDKEVNINTELFIINSIMQSPEVISELYFMEGKHFKKFTKEFEFIKQRLLDAGEIEQVDLYMNGYKIQHSEVTYNHHKIINACKSIFDEYQKSQMLQKIKKITKDLSLEEVQSELNKILTDVDLEYQKNKLESNFMDIAEKVLKNAFEKRKSKTNHGIQLRTLPSMNQIIGGLVETDLVGIFGKSKSSKSSLAMEMILDIAVDQGTPSAIFSFEMDEKLVTMKGISMRTGIAINELRNPAMSQINDEEFQNYIANATRTFYDSNLFVIDEILDEYEIENRIKKLVDSKGVKVVLIDYLLLISSRHNHKFQSTREELNHLSKFFKRVAQKLKIVVILISQANEEGRAAESKSLERDSNYFFLVWHLEPGEELRINNEIHKANTDEYIVKCKGIRHGKGNDWFVTRFENNIYKEIETTHTILPNVSNNGSDNWYERNNQESI